jgi:hypothetical protein
MPFQEPTFKGNEVYTEKTNNVVIGDIIMFERATFTGSFRSPKFSGFQIVEGKVINESYGAGTAQHTFTIELKTGENRLIKGRNMYKNGVYRKPWTNEKELFKRQEEKNARGASAKEEQSWKRSCGIL